MDRRERLNDPEEMLRMAFEGMLSGVWTGLPAYVVSYNAALQTCVVQPTVMSRQQQPDGSFVFAKLPVLQDCPVGWQGGGGFSLTFPLAKGDEGMVLFSNRCIDGWWQNSGVQVPPEIRMYDLSDGFFLPKFRSKPKALPNVSTTSTQWRSDDGSTFVEVADGQVVNVTAPQGMTFTTPSLTISGIINVENVNNQAVPCAINGAITATGEITSTLGGNHTLTQHVHGGVQAGASNTATPHN